jgi:pyruvate/2-oxoacid:ferredoxin oxidoreductase alpha subunit
MKALQVIACAYGSACGGAAIFGASSGRIILIAVAGLAHAGIASNHGIRVAKVRARVSAPAPPRGEQGDL